MSDMSIGDFITGHDVHDRDRELLLTTTQQALTDEELAHSVTTAQLDQANADIAVKDAELVTLRERVAFCDANHSGDDPEDPQPPDLTLVTPLSALALHRGYGVCQHVNFQTNIHQHQAEILERYGAMRVGSMRSMYAPNLSNFDVALAAARQHGVKWHALVATMDSTEAEVRNKIRHMADNAADVVDWIEGVNEPNGDGFTAAIATKTALIQWWIWDEVHKHPELAHVTVLSPSMHDTKLENANGTHWEMFANALVTVDGVVKGRGRDFCQGAAVHGYQAGRAPHDDPKLAQRLAWPREALGKQLVKVTEMGWTNTTGPKASRTGGHKVTSERASAAYDVQAVLVYGKQGIPFMRYEFMDDPDSNKTVTEANFGLWEVETIGGNPDLTWTPKPVIAPLTELLTWLEDPGTSYQPTDVGLEVVVDSGNVDWVAVQKRDGSTRVYLWSLASLWDPIDEVNLTPAPAQVTVTDAQGSRFVTVGAQPVPVDLRA